MIVEYTSISDYLTKLQETTRAGGREIEYVALTKKEWEEFCRDEVGAESGNYIDNGELGEFLGITLVGYDYHLEKRKRQARERHGI